MSVCICSWLCLLYVGGMHSYVVNCVVTVLMFGCVCVCYAVRVCVHFVLYLFMKMSERLMKTQLLPGGSVPLTATGLFSIRTLVLTIMMLLF